MDVADRQKREGLCILRDPLVTAQFLCPIFLSGELLRFMMLLRAQSAINKKASGRKAPTHFQETLLIVQYIHDDELAVLEG